MDGCGKHKLGEPCELELRHVARCSVGCDHKQWAHCDQFKCNNTIIEDGTRYQPHCCTRIYVDNYKLIDRYPVYASPILKRSLMAANFVTSIQVGIKGIRKKNGYLRIGKYQLPPLTPCLRNFCPSLFSQ